MKAGWEYTDGAAECEDPIEDADPRGIRLQNMNRRNYIELLRKYVHIMNA